MTQPAMIFFGPDGRSGPLKIVLRMLLFSTAVKGHIVENMYVKLKIGESTQNFNIWTYGQKSGDWMRGSGLFVGKEGVPYYHHFLLPKNGLSYKFSSGEYGLSVFAQLLGRKKLILLFEQKLQLSEQFAKEITDENSGVFFDWNPDSQNYYAHFGQESE